MIPSYHFKNIVLIDQVSVSSDLILQSHWCSTPISHTFDVPFVVFFQSWTIHSPDGSIELPMILPIGRLDQIQHFHQLSGRLNQSRILPVTPRVKMPYKITI